MPCVLEGGLWTFSAVSPSTHQLPLRLWVIQGTRAAWLHSPVVPGADSFSLSPRTLGVCVDLRPLRAALFCREKSKALLSPTPNPSWVDMRMPGLMASLATCCWGTRPFLGSLRTRHYQHESLGDGVTGGVLPSQATFS